MDKSTLIVEQARNSLGSFCFEECNAYCCRKGYLEMNNESVDTVTKGRTKELKKKGTLVTNKNKSTIYLGDTCPSLQNFKCSIWKNSLKPSTCSKYPIFEYKNFIRFSGRCLAVKENKFYEHIHQLKKLGKVVVIGDSLEGYEKLD